ncbi:hypothetical protein AQUSIP_13210 [Aquicella siphonis]|uniref:Uncharacterized protein n=1 Tax=Aquicella siphonis TaxID=254247 RepID=A0A5E4PG76_9COXI|nr:hypothetical protein [Aquicella siphonis]VVC76020.1 hypothetical protein AQUSIP_13210 [Aquicella siphonis]
MDLKTLGQTVIKYGAPLLGTAIGGPAGTAIGQIVASEFGGDLNAPDDLANKIITDPNARVKLAEIESNQKVQLQNIAMQMAKNDLDAQTQQLQIAAQDTADARKNNVQSKSIMPEIISFLVITGMFGCIWLVSMYKQDSVDHDVLYMLFGSVSAAFGSVIQYWLGSSAGSKVKDMMIQSKK